MNRCERPSSLYWQEQAPGHRCQGLGGELVNDAESSLHPAGQGRRNDPRTTPGRLSTEGGRYDQHRSVTMLGLGLSEHLRSAKVRAGVVAEALGQRALERGSRQAVR
jgi:hypothetical protein